MVPQKCGGGEEEGDENQHISRPLGKSRRVQLEAVGPQLRFRQHGQSRVREAVDGSNTVLYNIPEQLDYGVLIVYI